MTFGSYLREMRELKKLRQADLAEEIGVSTVYVCDIERDRRYPPELDKLRVWILQLGLSADEEAKLFDLAGDARETTPPDIAAYLDRNSDAKNAIRRIMGQQTDYNWDNIPKKQRRHPE